ncbi:biotin carboxyl carrier protein of acetyl-coa carboxylase 2 chloroplastic [Phtheirospermum japonicum]|uniref:Biotin carboxyl carrier protein of acetyl-CoA carboxylase n=1 Tax=Phtheirospermum japonicum TaxID=374723 RepID=A0A830D540_9LAMI|nr:biotin carboxyl carrier protein of acetyl-coa carboxylase 2 chloroplastic [Phtheirospermum japonicum]
MASFSVPCPKISPLLAAPSRSSQKRQYIVSFLRSESKFYPPSIPAQFQGKSRNQSNVFKVCAQLKKSIPPLDKTLVEEPKSQYEIPDASSISVFMNQVSDLIKLVDSRDILELELKQMDCEVVIRKKVLPQQHSAAASAYFTPPPTHHQSMLAKAPALTSVFSVPTTPASLAAPAKPKSSHPPFKCPMAGNLYRSPAPGAPPFVKVGDKVQKGQVICIIEAMKLMNEIEADHSGTVVEILVDDGKPVSIDMVLPLLFSSLLQDIHLYCCFHV